MLTINPSHDQGMFFTLTDCMKACWCLQLVFGFTDMNSRRVCSVDQGPALANISVPFAGPLQL